MTKPFSKFAALAFTGAIGLTLAGCVSTPQAATVEAPVPVADPSPADIERAQIEKAKTEFLNALCDPGEEVAFVGSVDDDFGIGLAVCMLEATADQEARITAVWEGEGGRSRTSCFVSECGDVLQFRRYTRYRYTTLTLAWEAFGQTHIIDETLDAEDLNAPANSYATYTWSSPELLESTGEPLMYPIEVSSQSLGLLKVERLLGQAI